MNWIKRLLGWGKPRNDFRTYRRLVEQYQREQAAKGNK